MAKQYFGTPKTAQKRPRPLPLKLLEIYIMRFKNFFSGALREKAKALYYHEFNLFHVMIGFIILYTILMVGLFYINQPHDPEPNYIDPVYNEDVERIA